MGVLYLRLLIAMFFIIYQYKENRMVLINSDNRCGHKFLILVGYQIGKKGYSYHSIITTAWPVGPASRLQ